MYFSLCLLLVFFCSLFQAHLDPSDLKSSDSRGRKLVVEEQSASQWPMPGVDRKSTIRGKKHDRITKKKGFISYNTEKREGDNCSLGSIERQEYCDNLVRGKDDCG